MLVKVCVCVFFPNCWQSWKNWLFWWARRRALSDQRRHCWCWCRCRCGRDGTVRSALFAKFDSSWCLSVSTLFSAFAYEARKGKVGFFARSVFAKSGSSWSLAVPTVSSAVASGARRGKVGFFANTGFLEVAFSVHPVRCPRRGENATFQLGSTSPP